jgi:hypothetical protein
VDNKSRNSDIACIKCEELENKLQETLLELSFAKLIIKLLQKEIDTITAPSCMMRPNIDSGFCGEHEVPNDNEWTAVTSGHFTNWDTLHSTLQNMENSPPDNILELSTVLCR